jgi:sugar lactone lactonase YvrE
MNNKIHSSIFSPSGKLLAAGLVAMTILAARLQAQYVSTVISNSLNEPYGVATDPNNNVYIADSVNNRIALYVPGTKTLSTLAGLIGTSGTNNGTNTAALFNEPQGIVYATSRNGLVVVDQGNQELRFVTNTGANTWVVSSLAGMTGVPGTNDGTGTNAQFCYPTGIAVANDGATLYIADQGNHRIRMVSNNVVTTLATNYLYNSATNRFNRPAAVAVDVFSNIWVADSGDHVICVISNGTSVAYGVAGRYRGAGTNDGPASTSKFNLPSGLLWDNNKNILVISDTENDTIRSLYSTNFQGVPIYAVQTLAGIPQQRGFVDGSLSTGEFNQPFGLCVDTIDSGYYVADWGNNAVRVLQPTQPPPPPTPVPNPVIGYVTFPLVDLIPSAQFNAITEPISVFNNVVPLAIEQLDPTVETYMSYGATGSVIPPPGTNTAYVSPFTDVDVDLPPGMVPVLDVPVIPALTLETISEAAGRPSSAAVSVQIQYVTANPNIIGQNAAAVTLVDATTNAQMWYTLDGSTPVPGASNTFPPSLTQGITSGQIISFVPVSNMTLTVQAFTSNASAIFAPSGTVTAQYTTNDFVTDQMTFGFASGEASSAFVASAGQTFYAPITLTLIPSAETMYSLQFSVSITNVTAPPVDGNFTFQSMLWKPLPGSSPPVYIIIPPEMVSISYTNISGTNVVITNGFTNLLFTNSSAGLLGVGWFEEPWATNLYVTTSQTLLTYSLAHDTWYTFSDGAVIVGGYSFVVPGKAQIGQTYQIQIGSPSATTYPIANVTIMTVTNGSLTNGAINSLKTVTVGQIQYLVGDVFPFGWFNAGDFGDSNLMNDDVIETFQSAIYGWDTPPAGSDYFDAMDSSNGKDNNLYNGNDTTINSITLGDGILAVDDVYVTYRRSLDYTLNWYNRYWSNGVRVAVQVSNTLTRPFSSVDPAVSAGASQPASQLTNSGPRYVTVAADQVISGGNLSVQVPVRVLAADTLPITVMMLHVEVDPLDGSPPITDAIGFSANTNLGTQFDSATQGANDFAAVWLNSTSTGVVGTGVIGTLSVTLPSNVTANSAYLVHFDHFSASPNGIALFHATVQDGLITVGDRSGSSWGDGIPDSWRLLWFGTVSNALSAADADPDGDGASNWEEYVAGTNPLDATSVFQLLPGGSFAPSGFTLQWPSVVNKSYTIQSSSGLSPGNWTTLASNILGNGQILQWTDTNATGQALFYRALVQ